MMFPTPYGENSFATIITLLKSLVYVLGFRPLTGKIVLQLFLFKTIKKSFLTVSDPLRGK